MYWVPKILLKIKITFFTLTKTKDEHVFNDVHQQIDSQSSLFDEYHV